MTAACVSALRPALAPETARGHEGIVYLLGQTDGLTSIALSVFRPIARTTRGSFHVDTAAMRQVVEAANAHGLQVVGQLHTHPGEAFHSDGDRSEEHTSELQSLMRISYAVFCLKKKTNIYLLFLN